MNMKPNFCMKKHTKGCHSFASSGAVVSPPWRTVGPAQMSWSPDRGCIAQYCCRISGGEQWSGLRGPGKTWMEQPEGC